jgi:cytochrome P450
VQRVFMPENSKAFWRAADVAASNFVRLLKDKGQKQVQFEVDGTFMALFLDVMGHAMLSTDFGASKSALSGVSESSPQEMDVLQAAGHVMKAINDLGLLPRKLWWWLYPKEEMLLFQRATSVIRNVAEKVTHTRAAALKQDAKTEAPMDFAGIMLEAKARSEDSGGNTEEPVLSIDEIIDEIMIMILGATETSAHTTSWLFWAMLRLISEAPPPASLDDFYEGEGDISKHAWRKHHGTPLIWKRIQEEVASVIGMELEKPIEWEALEKLQYVEGAVKETLRLFNVAGATSRQVAKPVEMCGHNLRKGDIIVLSNLAMHSDSANFPHPMQFMPERWFSDAPEDIRPQRFGAFNAFGGGPKMCIGHKVALVQMKVMLVRLAQAVSTFSLAETAPPVKPLTALTTRPQDGVHIVMTLK